MFQSMKIALWTMLLLAVVTLQAADQPAADIWVVSQLAGTVAITAREQAVRPAITIGDRLGTPFSVKTGAAGSIILTHGDDRVSVGPNAQLVFPAGQKPAARNTVHINQRLGSVLYNVEHRRQDTFSVETPYLVSVVKGTVFTITTTTEDSAVALMEGSLLVTTLDRQDELLLEPGQVAVKPGSGERILLLDEQKLSAAEEGPVTLIRHDGTSQKTVDIRMGNQVHAKAARLSGLSTSNNESSDVAVRTVDLSGDDGRLSAGSGNLTIQSGDVTGRSADLTGRVVDLTGSAVDVSGATTDLTGSVTDLTGATTDLTGSTVDVSATTTNLTNSAEDLTTDTAVINAVTQDLLR